LETSQKPTQLKWEKSISHTNWKNRSCLVTGGTGFGGSHLCIELLELGAIVYVLDKLCLRNSYLCSQGADKHIQFIYGDVRDLGLLQGLIERHSINIIFHLAAQPLVAPSNIVPFETLDINIAGTYTILEAMRSTGPCKSLILASSGAYYGSTTTGNPIREDDPPAPTSNIYGASKSAADVVARAYAQVFGLDVAACRFMNTYGPGDLNFSRLIPRALRNLIDNADYQFGDRDDGTTKLDFLFIRDMTKAYIAVAENLQKIRGEAFNFGSGACKSTEEVARLVSIAFDGRERQPGFFGPLKSMPLIKRLDISKSIQQLGWMPVTSFEEGLRQTVEWYRRYGVHC
jgi:CDP-glucose 4,6-dehydratase